MHRSIKPSRWFGWAGALYLMAILLIVGCRRVPEKDPPGDSKQSSSATPSVEDEASRFLSSVVNLLTGEVDAGTYTSAVIQLNKFVDRRPGAIADLTAEQRTQITRVLGAGSVASVGRKTFAEDDIEALRKSFLLRRVASQKMSGGAKLVQAVRLFDWTCEQVALAPRSAKEPATPAEVLLRASGDPQERMWVFLELLRQSDLSGAVLGVTTKEDPQTLVPWLVGVFDGSDFFLFDPVIGRPLPSSDPARPMTLAEWNSDRMKGAAWYGESHPVVDPSKIEKVAIMLPIEGDQLAPRMAFLQSTLTGQDRVNLTVDLDAQVKRASEVLAGVTNQAGVQIWRFPEETTRAYLNIKRETPEGLSRWQQVRFRPRLADLEGRGEEAVREFVSLDLNPVSPVVWDLSIQSLKLPTARSRSLIARADGGISYFGALAQRGLHPEDGSYADEWLGRYLERALDPKVADRDLFEVVILGRQLAGYPDRARHPLEERVFNMLTESAQKSAKKAADTLERAAIVPAPAAEARPTVSIPEPLTPAELSDLLQSLNDALAKPDLVDESLADTLMKDLPMNERPIALLASSESRSPEGVRWRNRLLFDFVFGESVLPADRPWLAGAIRLRASIQEAADKRPEALATLEREYPMLTPMAVTSLAAEARRLRSLPGN